VSDLVGYEAAVSFLRSKRGEGSPRRARLSKVAGLRLGFGAMVALLVFSAVEAYRIQDTASRQTAEIYHRFVQQGDTLYRIRRLLFMGSIYTRDFLLSQQGDRAEIFRKQLQALKADANATLDELQLTAAGNGSFPKVRANVQEFWTVLESTLGWTQEMRSSRAYQFVQSEVVPRRNAAGDLLRELATVNESVLKNSEAEFARSRRAAMFWLSGVVAFSVLLGLMVARFSLSYAGRLEREGLRRFEEVTQAKKDLEQLSARLLEIQEDERKRLSRELHDEIGQTLTALRIEISHALAGWRGGSPETQARLEQARALAEKTLQSVRNTSLLLRPALLDDLGLEPALQWQVEDFIRRSGIRCSFAGEGLQEPLPDAHKTCVYRVVQEALNNCEKHAGATEVRLRVRQTEQALTVQIEDNGRGFAVDKSGAPIGRAGLGILGMRERAANLGGVLKLESTEGKGTRLSLALPLIQPGARLEIPVAAGGVKS
jgi:signal transduction histidine kinase